MEEERKKGGRRYEFDRENRITETSEEKKNEMRLWREGGSGRSGDDG